MPARVFECVKQVASAVLEDKDEAGGQGPVGEAFSKPFTGEKILIATGTTPARRPDFQFDGVHIIDR